MNILLLEDDLILNEIIYEYLESLDYSVKTTYSGLEAQDELYSNKFDLLVFDVNVPDINGFELLKELRDNNIKTPAIYITSLDMVEDIEKGFQSGCDDYIKKPFELKELKLRIDNIKRIFNMSSQNSLQITSNAILHKDNLTIKTAQKEYHISKKESEVLEYFYKNSKRVISIEELSLNVWAYENSPDASTIRTYIKNIRKILGDEIISNIRGVGYRFNKQWETEFL